ncbi:MAG: hypothetical protein U0835_14640 [Isosphaeraceae bacterium]
MMEDRPEQEEVVLEMSRGELILINNALNEVCNGIHMGEDEFQTRLGASVEDARRLLRRIRALLDS